MQADLIFDAYETDMRSRRLSNTSMREFRIVRERFTEYLRSNGLDADTVKRPHIQDFFASSGWSPATQHARLTWLAAPFRDAVDEYELLDRNPCRRVRLAPVPRRDVRTIPNETLRSIKNRIYDPVDLAVFVLFAYTGMRLSEVRGLTWDGVSHQAGSLNFIRKGGHEGTIPMHPEVARALKALGTWRGGSAYVIPGQAGHMMSDGGMDKRVKKLTGPDFSAHDFRHTVASSLEHNGAREAAIYAILGWSPDGSIRLRHYTAMPMHVLYRELCKLYADDPV